MSGLFLQLRRHYLAGPKRKITDPYEKHCSQTNTGRLPFFPSSTCRAYTPVLERLQLPGNWVHFKSQCNPAGPRTRR